MNPAICTVDIRQIWISPGHDFKGRHGLGRERNGVVACDEVECCAGKGIVGDRYFDHKPDFKGQITFFSLEVADALTDALNLADIDHSAFRRNVLIRGVDLNTLVGKEFRLGNVVLTGSEECAPCYWMDDAIAPGAHEWLKGRGGLRCRIVESGTLSTGQHELEIIS